jgi:hypothetical protein
MCFVRDHFYRLQAGGRQGLAMQLDIIYLLQARTLSSLHIFI